MTKVDKWILSLKESDVRLAIAESHCISYVGLRLGLPNNGTGGRIVRRLIEIYQIDTSHFNRGKRLRKYADINKQCPVCGNKFVTKENVDKKTCSYKCSNTFFRSGDQNGRRAKKLENIADGSQQEYYAFICWRYHKKECIVCKEHLVVAVHHLNHDHCDNRPENLVPLCPTHHMYWHSRHKHLIEQIVLDYVSWFKQTVLSDINSSHGTENKKGHTWQEPPQRRTKVRQA